MILPINDVPIIREECKQNVEHSELINLKLENLKLKKALEFYATPQIYYFIHGGGDQTLDQDKGRKAREALGLREEPLHKRREE